MPFESISGAVGNPAGMGGNPVNQPNDVLTVKKLLYGISSSEGGPSSSDLPVCDPAGGGIYNPRMTQIILNFQLARRAKGVPMQGEQMAGGRVMPGSATWKELVRLAGSASSSPQQTQNSNSPGANGYLGNYSPLWTPPPTDWNPAPTSPPLNQDPMLLRFLTSLAAKRTNWSLAGGAGFSVGAFDFGFGLGTFVVTRPSGSSFNISTTSVSAGISVAPVSASASGPETPGTALPGVYANGAGALVDDDFTGPYLALSLGITFVACAGVGGTLLFGGFGNCAPGWSSLVALLGAGPVGPVLSLLTLARVVTVFGGVQYGTPDGGCSLSAGIAQTPKQMGDSMKLFDKTHWGKD